MTEYDNNMRGVLFKNDRKEQPNHPDYKGSITINGVEYWLSSWIKTSERGKFMSLSAKPKEEPKQAAPIKPHPQGWQRDDDSSIPF